MPYQVSIPDVCDRWGCTGSEAAELIAMATKTPLMDVKLPTVINRHMVYSANGHIQAEARWYISDLRREREDEEANS